MDTPLELCVLCLADVDGPVVVGRHIDLELVNGHVASIVTWLHFYHLALKVRGKNRVLLARALEGKAFHLTGCESAAQLTKDQLPVYLSFEVDCSLPPDDGRSWVGRAAGASDDSRLASFRVLGVHLQLHALRFEAHVEGHASLQGG